MQRDANISGRAGSIKGGLASMQDNFMAKLGGEFGGERVSSLVRLETKLGNEIKALNALRDTLTASHSSTSSENITDFNKQRSAVQSRRQDLIVQRELSGMGTGATDAVLKEFPCPQAL